MKRLDNLYDRLCDFRTLETAFMQVRRGKSHRADVMAFERETPENLNLLVDVLRRGEFEFGDYTFFKVYEPKERTIAAASIRERIVHHAIIHLVGERLERALVDKSYACRKGKGQWKAVGEAERLARLHPWCLKLDIRHYFDSIDHGVLKGMLRRKIKDGRFLDLLDELIDSYHIEDVAGGCRDGRTAGLPIGNLTSQYFANLYLDSFDRWLDGWKVAHVRYMDDVLVFGERENLRSVFTAAPAFLKEALRLELKAKGGLHRTIRGVDFLGCRVLPGGVRLSAQSRRRFLRKLARYDALFNQCGEAWLQRRQTALFAFVRHVNSYGFRRKAVEENRHGTGADFARGRLQQQRQRAELPLGLAEQRESVQPQPQQQQQRQLRLSACRPARSSMHEAHQNSRFSCSGFELGQTVVELRPAQVGAYAENYGRSTFKDVAKGEWK